MNVRARSILAALLVTGAVAGCRSDSPSPVSPSAPSFSKKVQDPKTSDTVTVVTRRVPFAGDVSVSAVIGANGGTLELKEAGLKVTVPKGAVSSNQTFSITALGGSIIAYEFTPHMAFAQPIRIEQSLGAINIPANVGNATIGYFADRSDIGGADAVGVIREELPVSFDLSGGKARFTVDHFSGYLMASGRR